MHASVGAGQQARQFPGRGGGQQDFDRLRRPLLQFVPVDRHPVAVGGSQDELVAFRLEQHGLQGRPVRVGADDRQHAGGGRFQPARVDFQHRARFGVARRLRVFPFRRAYDVAGRAAATDVEHAGILPGVQVDPGVGRQLLR